MSSRAKVDRIRSYGATLTIAGDRYADALAASERVVGVEPVSAPTLTSALKTGRPVDVPAGGVAADSLASRRVGDLAFPIARRYVDRVVVAEPGGATALAALLSGEYAPEPGERVGVVISGANSPAVDFGARVWDAGLASSSATKAVLG